MANNSQNFTEGASINKSPLFVEETYPFWKIRMKTFLESIDKGLWDVVVNGPFVPTKTVNDKKNYEEYSLWTLDENKSAHYDYDVRDKNIISSVLTLDEF